MGLPLSVEDKLTAAITVMDQIVQGNYATEYKIKAAAALGELGQALKS